ncbi:MAG: hypothetical protein JWL77_1562 [Chthonomonadaceae bacterium]|nr:hypothetical protein [Chthonomonadaceae bacterium]
MVHSRCIAKLTVLALLFCLVGCGGATSLTGGSVPIGGRAITATVLLPNGTPAANATVTVRTLSSGTVLQTATTNAMGQFTTSAVPVDADLDVVVTQPPTNTLELVIPHNTITGQPNQPFDAGQITALSTLVAAAIKLEQQAAPENPNGIAGNQVPSLMAHVNDQNFSESDQQTFISDPNSLHNEALTVLGPTANAELAAFNANPTTDTATAALNGLLGNVRVGHDRGGVHLSSTLQTALINAALNHKQYTTDAVAAALQFAARQPVTAAQVMTASQKERGDLPALAASGAGISPFEALAIGGDSDPHGGFQLDQNGLNSYLTYLLNHG